MTGHIWDFNDNGTRLFILLLFILGFKVHLDYKLQKINTYYYYYSKIEKKRKESRRDKEKE